MDIFRQNNLIGRSFTTRFDWKLNGAVLFLSFLSLLSLFSTKPSLFDKQLLWIIIGIFAAFLITQTDWRSLVNYKGVIWGFYIFTVSLLALTLFLAPKIRGTKSWIPLWSFQLQPSEFVKIALIIVLAIFFSKRHKSIALVSNLIYSFALFLLPAVFIMAQPDLGSVLLIFSIWFGFVLVSGIRYKHLAIVIVIFLVAVALMWNFALKDYQKERITGLFFPQRDELGINYNVIQSKIAIGSAGFFGKGFKQGSQAQLGFLPEAQTDFIFAAIVEEWGLFSAFLIFAAFLLMILRIVKIGLDADNNFGKFLCLGSAILFLANFLFNIGSNIALTPVIGVPFPFLSYGGSHIITEFILIGFVQAVKVRRA